MILLISVALVGLWGILATIVVVARDGYHRVPDDPNYNSRAA